VDKGINVVTAALQLSATISRPAGVNAAELRGVTYWNKLHFRDKENAAERVCLPTEKNKPKKKAAPIRNSFYYDVF